MTLVAEGLMHLTFVLYIPEIDHMDGGNMLVFAIHTYTPILIHLRALVGTIMYILE